MTQSGHIQLDLELRITKMSKIGNLWHIHTNCQFSQFGDYSVNMAIIGWDIIEYYIHIIAMFTEYSPFFALSKLQNGLFCHFRTTKLTTFQSPISQHNSVTVLLQFCQIRQFSIPSGLFQHSNSLNYDPNRLKFSEFELIPSNGRLRRC